jgi:hypothetical protein
MFIALLVYTDDIIIARNNDDAVAALTKFLYAQFKLKDHGNVKYFIGLEIDRSTKGIYLCQRKYALEILEDSGMLASKPAKFPKETNLKLSRTNGELLTDPTSYKRLAERHLYLTITKPDISYSIQILIQFMDCPRKPHLDAANRVLSSGGATAGFGGATAPPKIFSKIFFYTKKKSFYLPISQHPNITSTTITS